MNWNKKSFSEKASLAAAVLDAVTLIAFCAYGMVYDYFDTVVFLMLALSAVCALCYTVLHTKLAELLNLASVFCVTFGLGLFFLNSYPVCADRLNHITMYGSRGTLVPVIAIMALCIVGAILATISCFTRKENT